MEFTESTGNKGLDAQQHPRKRQRRYDARLNLPLRREVLEALDEAAQSEDVSACVVARRGIARELERIRGGGNDLGLGRDS